MLSKGVQLYLDEELVVDGQVIFKIRHQPISARDAIVALPLDNPPVPLHNGRFSMADSSKQSIHIQPEYEPLLRAIGLTAEGVFTSPAVKPWRVLADRENCTLDATLEGKTVRLHVKRYPVGRGRPTPAEAEVAGLSELITANIPTSPLVAWGVLPDGRNFLITADLAGYIPGDKLIERGTPFAPLLVPTADLAAKLHLANLHHRDLYLCHFLTKFDGDQPDLRLIDTARVAKLGNFFTRSRWIVKDLAQFWYSTMKLPIDDQQRDAWLKRYAEQRSLPGYAGLKKAVLRKVAWIAKHDRSLNAKQPGRNVSIPS